MHATVGKLDRPVRSRADRLAMRARSQYWILDCVLALTAIALGTVVMCAVMAVALPSQSGIALGAQAVVWARALAASLLFIAVVWQDQPGPGPAQVRAFQANHANMLKRVSRRSAAAPRGRRRRRHSETAA
jgi:hypothetical protein